MLRNSIDKRETGNTKQQATYFYSLYCGLSQMLMVNNSVQGFTIITLVLPPNTFTKAISRDVVYNNPIVSKMVPTSNSTCTYTQKTKG
jgi:hypothetical protein